MSKFSRRSFLAGLSTVPFALWFEKYGAAQTTLTRYSATSAAGQKLLASYAAAVRNMMNRPANDPLSWVFQWYTHWIPGPTRPQSAADKVKTDVLNKTFTNPSDPNRALAQAMWDTCQPHGVGYNENFFLPWHRMYVYFFESIVRKLSGNASFTLPYWNYSVGGAQHGVMPGQFRMQNDPTFGPLYRQARNVHTSTNGWANVNAGEAIDRYQPSGFLSTSSLAQCTYEPQGQAVPGFNMDLDTGLHGNVHVGIGNGTNMGSVPTAAGDPVFWMHHCNIDRLWASWNRAGRQNPTAQWWLDKTFTFASADGTLVTAKIDDFKDVAPLRYDYDAYETVPQCQAPPLAAAAPQRRAVTPAGGIRLGSQPVRLTLQAPPEVSQPVPLATAVRDLRPERRLFLVVRGLSADVQPGIVYHLYLNMPANTPPARRQRYYVGTINFFHGDDHGGHAGHAAGETMGQERFRSFDVTDLIRRQHSARTLGAQPMLTVVPSGQPAAAATPVVGEITLVEQ